MSYPRTLKDRLFLLCWNGLWHLLVPVVLVYLWRRGRKEPEYFKHMAERFGGGQRVPNGAIWIHAVSLGETRAVSPLVRALIDRGEVVLLTHITAAGRAESARLFANEIANGQLHVRWCPMELSWAVKRFIRRHQPKFGLIMEIEIWPQMIAAANRLKLPLIMAQAQYPDKSFDRDQKGIGRLRSAAVQGFDLILAKSDRHADRFRHFGAHDVRRMGELKFEQDIPEWQLTAADRLRKDLKLGSRPVICLASTAPDEDPMLIPVLQDLKSSDQNPFFVYVPRHPKDFKTTHDALKNAGFNMLHRSKDFDETLQLIGDVPAHCDGLFGDSLGEINFYYQLADTVFVGDSFNGEGSHNIIEPLRLNNPVVVGPSIWGIEYPALEAMEAGVLTKLADPQELVAHWTGRLSTTPQQIDAFLSDHGGAIERAIGHLIDFGVLD